MEARRIRVEGRVQGVFFRDWAVGAARALRLAGWVRNRPDGSVELHAEGTPDALDALAAQCHHGPPAAGVTRVTVEVTVGEAATGFTRRPTG